MSMKRNYSKKLSKTIALAVMAMGLMGVASVASAEIVMEKQIRGDADGTSQYSDVAYKEYVSRDESGNLVYSFKDDLFINRVSDTPGDSGIKGSDWNAASAINNYGGYEEFEAGKVNMAEVTPINFTIDMNGHKLKINDVYNTGRTNSSDRAYAINMSLPGTMIIDNVAGMDITAQADAYYAGGLQAHVYDLKKVAQEGCHLIINNLEGLDNAVKIRSNVDFSNVNNYGILIDDRNVSEKSASSITIKNLVDVEVADGGFAAIIMGSAPKTGNAKSTIDIGGGRLIGRIATGGPKAEININVEKDSEGNVIGAGNNPVQIEGLVGVSTGYYGAGGTINIGLNNEESYLKGSLGGLIAGKDNNLNIWLKNGALCELNALSQVGYLHGAEQDEKVGTLHINEKTLQARMISGTTNVLLNHDEENPVKKTSGDIRILGAQPGAKWNVYTNTAGLENPDNATLKAEFDALAAGLIYTAFTQGENNLSVELSVADENVKHSTGMGFDSAKGTGKVAQDSEIATDIMGTWNGTINDDRKVTVTETGTWAPTGENVVPSLKGEAGSAINMSNADSLKVDNYSGETTMLYGHDESNPTQIIGGDVNIGKAEEGSKVTMSTDNNGINTLDKGQVESVLNSMANKLTYEAAAEGENNLTGKLQIAEGLTASSAAVKAGDIEFGKDGKGSLKAGSVDYGAEETAVMGAMKGALLSSALMVRAESNDLLKRMGDVRLAEEDRGLWAKYYGGKYEMDSANAHVSYKAYQLGYDTKAGKNWTVGGAVSYNEGKDGKTELKNTAVGVYGTWADDKGQYIDLITKIGWLKNDFDVKAAGYQIADTMKTTGMSMSAEYGKRFENKAGSFIEPNAELTFGHLNGKKVNANVVGGGTTLGVDQDAFNSLVGRLGLRIGHKNAKSSVYAKVALAHEFAGDFDVTFSAPSEPTKKVSVDLKDTWGEFQIGGTTKLGKAGLLYANYQRSFAGDIKEKYRVDAGLRWSF